MVENKTFNVRVKIKINIEYIPLFICTYRQSKRIQYVECADGKIVVTAVSVLTLLTTKRYWKYSFKIQYLIYRVNVANVKIYLCKSKRFLFVREPYKYYSP